MHKSQHICVTFRKLGFTNRPIICGVWFISRGRFKVFLSTDCPYWGVNVRFSEKSVKVRTRKFFWSLQSKTYNATGILNLVKI